MEKAPFHVIVCLVFPLAMAHAQAVDKLNFQALTQTFDSSGDTKAQGARVTVRYPVGWKAQESARPKTIRNFLGDYAGVPATLSLAIEAHGEGLEGTCAQASREDWIVGSVAPNWTITKAHLFSRNGKPAVKIEIMQVSKVGGFVIHSQMQTMSVCHERYMVKAICGTSTVTAELVKSSMQKIAPLCQKYFEYLTING